MSKVSDIKCLGCGATIKYDTKKKLFICEYCNSKYTLEDIEKHKEKTNNVDDLNHEFDKLDDINGYHCDNCGASIISLDNISSTKCIYCKSNAIIKNRLSGVYKPESIIPFEFTKEDAINKFKEICKGRILMPSDFSDVNNIQEMEGLYVPFWLYDCENDCSLSADCTKVTTWSDSKYMYTKTDHYDVKRGGTLKFESIPNDGSIRFDDKIMNAIEPFDYKKLKEFNTSFLAGFLSEKYDVEKDEAYKNAKGRIETDSINSLKSSINYTSVLVREKSNNIKVNNTKYVLLPVWVLNIKYKDKIYHFAMNGESGKLVGEIPVSGFKLFITILLSFIIPAILMIIFFLVKGYVW